MRRADDSSFTLTGDPTLTGILRHELGHTIGFRHEHHLRLGLGECNGTGDWSLVLTSRDQSAARSVYP